MLPYRWVPNNLIISLVLGQLTFQDNQQPGIQYLIHVWGNSMLLYRKGRCLV